MVAPRRGAVEVPNAQEVNALPTIFTVGLRQDPGELGRLAKLLGDRGVNIESIAGVAHGDHAIVNFIPSDADVTRELFKDLGAGFDETEALTASLPNRPGELATLAKALGDAGANITVLLPLEAGPEGGEFAMAFEDASKAKEVLE